jgi:lysozyme family protein
MNTLTVRSPANSERDFSWMDDATYPLNTALIDKAVGELDVENAHALTRLASLSDRGTKHERVTGPFEGYFIASYGCCIDELGDEYIGNYKICETRPENYWKAHAKFIGWCSHTEPTWLAAMELAEATAQEHLLQALLSRGPASGYLVAAPRSLSSPPG